jgi:hypothetical protein
MLKGGGDPLRVFLNFRRVDDLKVLGDYDTPLDTGGILVRVDGESAPVITQ